MAPGAAFHRPFGRTAAPDARRCRARWWIASAASIGVGAATGCVTIPQYDSKTDDMLTGLQKDTDTFIGHLSDTYDNSTSSGKACAYPQTYNRSKQFRLTLGLLKTRAAALYANTGTEAALNNLQATYDALENAHKQADTRPDHCILPALWRRISRPSIRRSAACSSSNWRRKEPCEMAILSSGDVSSIANAMLAFCRRAARRWRNTRSRKPRSSPSRSKPSAPCMPASRSIRTRPPRNLRCRRPPRKRS